MFPSLGANRHDQPTTVGELLLERLWLREAAGDNLVSTVRSVVESLGGHLEMVAVFGDERIALEFANSK